MLMMSAYVHAIAGSSPSGDCDDTPIDACWFCGGSSGRSMPTKKWIKDGFTNGNRVRAPDSDRVCEGCVFICSRLSPVPGRPPAAGKKFGGNYRNYSHCVEVLPSGNIDYVNATKAENDRITTFLRRPKVGTWFAAIAQSGQKHCIPWAPANGPGIYGVVSFDDVIVPIPSDQRQWVLLDDVESLMADGIPRGAILDGRWSVEMIRKHREKLRAFDDRWGRQRGGPWFSLVLHLAMKEKNGQR